VLSWLPSAAISIVSVAVMTFLMLVEGPRLLGARAQHSRADVRRRWQAFAQVRGDLARYFGLIAAINLGLGVVSAATFAWLGLPNAWLWGTVVAALNFVPYVGPAVATLLVAAAALVAFDGLADVAAVVLAFITITTVEGQLVQPWLVGRHARVSPLLVFIAIWVGGWLWGVIGMVLAAPLAVAAQAWRKALASTPEESARAEWDARRAAMERAPRAVDVVPSATA
jgi:predicted PurR-regulated permease PerM